MPDATNEAVARQYADAASRADLATMERLRHPEWQARWPQSGERVEGSVAFRAIIERYPGGAPRTETQRVVGLEDRWVVTPGNTVLQVAGNGDFWWAEWLVTYPDGRSYHCVDLIELRAGRVWRETVYWADPFEPPEWRQAWVTVEQPSEVGVR